MSTDWLSCEKWSSIQSETRRPLLRVLLPAGEAGAGVPQSGPARTAESRADTERVDSTQRAGRGPSSEVTPGPADFLWVRVARTRTQVNRKQ